MKPDVDTQNAEYEHANYCDGDAGPAKEPRQQRQCSQNMTKNKTDQCVCLQLHRLDSSVSIDDDDTLDFNRASATLRLILITIDFFNSLSNSTPSEVNDR